MAIEKSTENVDLGFAEECEPGLLTNRYFPSKIGGKPAWLELKNLPNHSELLCPKCNEPRIFLCQIYAPIESRNDCFHRTIFLFVCKNEPCYELNSAKNIIAFRSQLPRVNDHYSPEPPGENILPEIKGPLDLCNVCGCHGPFLCSQCKKIHYCSVVHQKIDWKYHKKACKKKETQIVNDNCMKDSCSSKLLFPEFTIDMEPESEPENVNSSENEEVAEKRRLKEYEDYMKSENSSYLKDVPESELSQFVSENIEDKQFSKFKKRIERNPKQILRYPENEQPLWITDKAGIIEESNIPNCENCGSKRVFEFQIMPQLLNYLKNDDIDWGILAVYTCSESCETKSKYLKEFVVKQDVISPETK